MRRAQLTALTLPPPLPADADLLQMKQQLDALDRTARQKQASSLKGWADKL